MTKIKKIIKQITKMNKFCHVHTVTYNILANWSITIYGTTDYKLFIVIYLGDEILIQ